MIKELESEKAVTEILKRNDDVLKPVSKNVYKILEKKNLGKFLQNCNSYDENTKKSKYSFITLGLWKW